MEWDPIGEQPRPLSALPGLQFIGNAIEGIIIPQLWGDGIDSTPAVKIQQSQPDLTPLRDPDCPTYPYIEPRLVYIDSRHVCTYLGRVGGHAPY